VEGMRTHRFVLLVAGMAVLLASAVAAASGGLRGTTQSSCGFREVQSPRLTGMLYSVFARRTDDVWAVGGRTGGRGQRPPQQCYTARNRGGCY